MLRDTGMSEPIAYPYASGDLIEQPNTYFYSAYKGPSFIREWKQSRSACRGVDAPPAKPLGFGGDSPTARYLESVAVQLTAPEFSLLEKHRLDALLRNFEAKKRIYEDYNSGFNSKDRTDYHALSLYVGFAEVMVAAYRRWRTLPYLNALIKCMDILCAMRDGLDRSGRQRLVWLIEAEADFVAELAGRLGVQV